MALARPVWLAAGVMMLGSPAGAELVLADGGRAGAVIVAPAEAGPVAAFAAGELKHYLDRATGASFAVVGELPERRPAILLGMSPAAAGMGLTVAELKCDGFLLRRVGEVVLLAGRDDPAFDLPAWFECRDGETPFDRGWRRRGIPECATAFAVYGFLERVAGVRWYYPGPLGEVVPRRARLTVDDLDVRDEPRLAARWAYRYGHYSPDPRNPNDFDDYVEMGVTDQDVTAWVLRNRRSTLHLPVNHMPPAHRFVDRFGTEHPDWFMQRPDGTRENVRLPGGRLSAYGHLCYSNPDLVDAVAADVDAFFSGRPPESRRLERWNSAVANGDYYSLLPHDYLPEGCCCVACQARKDRTGPKSGLLSSLIWGYVAEVGRRIEGRHPGKYLVCLAYNAYRRIPRDVSLPGNVIACPTALHLGDGSDNSTQAALLTEIRDWRRFTGRPVGLWVYSALEAVDGPKLRGLPMTEYRAMGRFYHAVRDDVMGCFFENDWKYGFQHHLDLYLFQRLTWNPDLDVDALAAEYCRDLYGPAAGEIEAVLRRCEELWTRHIVQPHAEVGQSPGGAAYRDIDAVSEAAIWQEVYTPEEMGRLTALIEAAGAKTRGTDHAARVALFRERWFGPLERRWQDRRKLEAIWAAQVPLPVDRFATPPVIDGRPDDAVWRDVPADRIGVMVPADGGQGDRPRTTVTLGYDRRNLYLLVTCDEPLIGGLKAPRRDRDDFDVATDDEVELFLDASALRRGFRHLLINAAGSLADRKVWNNLPSEWDSRAEVAVRSDRHSSPPRWVVEAAIPLNTLWWTGQPPKPGERWVANFARARNVGDAAVRVPQLATWSEHVQGAFARPERFGLIEFTDRSRG